MTLLAELRPEDAHGDILVAFVPDEEIGLRGAKALDLARFACDFAYTIDCCELGEVVIENFNAAHGEIVFTGVSAHPMSAKGVLVNPLLMAHGLHRRVRPRARRPSIPRGAKAISGSPRSPPTPSEARLKVMIREFDKARFEQRKRADRRGRRADRGALSDGPGRVPRHRHLRQHP